MKCSESWLLEWVNPNLSLKELCDKLTMAGLEVEGVSPANEPFTGIVIGEVLDIAKHPESDNLHICSVNIDLNQEPIQIVCGASNVKVGMKYAVAMIDAVLPNSTIITQTSIRGVKSHGMLCSAHELGLSDDSQVLLELPTDAPIGADVWNYLQLNDSIMEIAITPNRGDCLSIQGIAREIAALTNSPLKNISIPIINPTIKDMLPITVNAPVGCPHYVGRIIRNVRADIATPFWIKERLRGGGIRSINPIVDVINYVMLELGQPMHAFDLNTIQGKIVVRVAKKGEQILLLDGSTQELTDDTLIIADDKKPLAIAGVMGGLDSSVNLMTNDIFIESAYFTSYIIAKQRQYYNLNSDSAYRYERGVDPTIQQRAIERATQLILEITGGEPGPLIDMLSNESLPHKPTIKLTKEKIDAVLGIDIPSNQIQKIFDQLHFSYNKTQFSNHNNEEWEVQIPPFRFDIRIPEDLIEEIARLHGYDKIPIQPIKATLEVSPDDQIDLQKLRQAFCHSGYNEIISYSFIDQQLQNLFDPEAHAYELVNPITADMAVMRTNLWPGLVNALLYNKSRQQQRVRLFEIGSIFLTHHEKIIELPRCGGIISGFEFPEQWGLPSRMVDFFDLKGDLENVLGEFCPKTKLIFKKETHPALHSGQACGIYLYDQKLGVMGALHPTIQQSLDLSTKVFMFEIDLETLKNAHVTHFREISKYPEIRRDIAIIVNQAIPGKEIQDKIKLIAGDWLKEVFIFDVYQGKGVPAGYKSIALSLILQHQTRTLVDDEVAELMERVITALKGQLGAELRSSYDDVNES